MPPPKSAKGNTPLAGTPYRCPLPTSFASSDTRAWKREGRRQAGAIAGGYDCGHLPKDGTARYNITLVLIDTFVETPRFTGALYKASGWNNVGTTRRCGRYDRHTKRDQPKKGIWLRPLRKDCKRTLNR